MHNHDEAHNTGHVVDMSGERWRLSTLNTLMAQLPGSDTITFTNFNLKAAAAAGQNEFKRSSLRPE